MSLPKLLRTPAPIDDEDYHGYWLRLARVNGYKNLKHMMPRTPRMSVVDRNTPAALKDMTGHDTQHLLGANHHRFTSWKNHQVASRYSSFPSNGHRICPDCMNELGYQLAKFRIKFYIVCVTHNKVLIDFCKECNEYLDENHADLSTCRRGHYLRENGLTYIPSNLVDIQIIQDAIIENKQASVVIQNSNRLPASSLLNLDLNVFLSLIDTIGLAAINCKFYTSPYAHFKNDISVLIAANSVFSEWPNNFYSFIQKYHRNKFEISFNFEDEWSVAFECLGLGSYPQDQVEFLREAYMEYVMNAWSWDADMGFDHHLHPGKSENAALSIYGLICGLTPTTLKLQVNNGNLIQVRMVNKKKGSGFNTKPVRDTKKEPSVKIYDAVQLLGVNVSTFKLLKEYDIINRSSIGDRYNGFTIDELEAFKKQILSKVIPDLSRAPADSKTIRQLAIEGKSLSRLPTLMIYGILNGYLNGYGITNRLENIMISAASYEKFKYIYQSNSSIMTKTYSNTMRIIDKTMEQQLIALNKIK